MFLKHLDLTSALRPYLLPGEVLLFTQDNVGLYEDKYKLANYQNGQVYLTSHRICYVDNEEPRKNCIAIELKDVERYEFYGGFLKSSPKITLVPNSNKQLPDHNRPPKAGSATSTRGISPHEPGKINIANNLTPEINPIVSATWICPICTFSNLVPSSFNPASANERTPVTPCSTCGVKPPWTLVLKAALSFTSKGRNLGLFSDNSPDPRTNTHDELRIGETQEHPLGLRLNNCNSFQCSRCTFLNHPSLMACELCNSPLISQETPLDSSMRRTESPGPSITSKVHRSTADIKISFRGGGEKIFHERLKGSLVQRKWLLHGAPPVPKPSSCSINCGTDLIKKIEVIKPGGIAGLEARRLQERQNNELVIGSAFEDLEALMASAQDIIALAESLASTNGISSSDSKAVASALGLITTKGMVSSSSESLYITEITRNLAEFLMDDARGVLSKAGGIISLVDLWANFNRARGGVELVSPNDFVKAAHQWEILKLPFRLRKFKSGVFVIQSNEHTDQKIHAAIRNWLKELHIIQPEKCVAWDWRRFGRGVTAQEAAEQFGWSLGVAEEELEIAEEEGILCREDGIEGIRYWINYFDSSIS